MEVGCQEGALKEAGRRAVLEKVVVPAKLGADKMHFLCFQMATQGLHCFPSNLCEGPTPASICCMSGV
jgi:hypothetical protein